MRPFRLPLLLLSLLACVSACDPDAERLTLRDVDRYTPALLDEALEPAWDRGRLNHRVLTGHYRASLELFAEHLDGHGPRTRPSLFRFPRQRIAFYANAHNGLALLAWLRDGSSDGDPTRAWNPAWSDRKHAIDGEMLSLDDLRGRVLAEGDRTTLLLLSRGRREDPAFPQSAFDGQLYDEGRGAHLRFIVNREGLFRDTSGRVVGPPWLRVLTAAEGPDADAGPPLGPARLAAFFDEFLRYDHPLRLQILRSAREGTLVPGDADPQIAVPEA
ncbi:DUF547 domain-containing protein [Phycisphaera mikurensis]|uniref:Uncharacterized protein n=1 Tax=Phycisphaera mikurensis (strain NBRC 102666 / KCTC 22515 / FYK2301M01) TaxID=1142394 RepID=I0IDQ8_PHYMF|nr:DUF547 domain-containing protein [Phycisphaera mikurensis]MBB6441211.1 hypothetical protein [Phycisphaera mikurensis]BAM03396.1 hypothetical protein PSMK_12370 [Phycisphaera mikurensis NBRC 102666]